MKPPSAASAMTDRVIRVQAEHRLDDVMGEVRDRDVELASVFEGDQWLGLVSLPTINGPSDRLFIDLVEPEEMHPRVRPEDRLDAVEQTMRRFNAANVAVVDDRGRFHGVISRESLREALTEHRLHETEHDKKQLQRRMDTVFDAAGDGILITTPAGRITDANASARQMLGLDRDGVVGRRAHDLLGGPFIEVFEDEDAQDKGHARDTGSHDNPSNDGTSEAAIHRSDGRTIPIEISVSPIPGEGFVCILRDITQRKDLERRLADAAVEERQILAQDMHDSLSGQMAAVGMYARNVCNRIEKSGLADEDPQAVELCRQLLEEIRNAHTDMRRLSHGLMPVEGGPEGFRDALWRLARRFDGTDGVHCHADLQDKQLVDNLTTATNLFQIAQEAVHNACTHGQARHLTLRLHNATTTTGELVIEDDGSGIRDPDLRSGGIGLRTMKHRADLVGGSLVVERRGEGGTRVTCRFPLPADIHPPEHEPHPEHGEDERSCSDPVTKRPPASHAS